MEVSAQNPQTVLLCFSRTRFEVPACQARDSKDRAVLSAFRAGRVSYSNGMGPPGILCGATGIRIRTRLKPPCRLSYVGYVSTCFAHPHELHELSSHVPPPTTQVHMCEHLVIHSIACGSPRKRWRLPQRRSTSPRCAPWGSSPCGHRNRWCFGTGRRPRFPTRWQVCRPLRSRGRQAL